MTFLEEWFMNDKHTRIWHMMDGARKSCTCGQHTQTHTHTLWMLVEWLCTTPFTLNYARWVWPLAVLKLVELHLFLRSIHLWLTFQQKRRSKVDQTVGNTPDNDEAVSSILSIVVCVCVIHIKIQTWDVCQTINSWVCNGKGTKLVSNAWAIKVLGQTKPYFPVTW